MLMYKTNFDPSTLSIIFCLTSFAKFCSVMYVGGTDCFRDLSYPRTNCGQATEKSHCYCWEWSPSHI